LSIYYFAAQVANNGVDYIYDTMADTIAKEIQEAGGIVTAADIRGYEPAVSSPVQCTVFGSTYLGSAGSSSGGAVVGGILQYLASYSTPLVSVGAVYSHRLIEAIKNTFAIRASLGDPTFVRTTGPIEALTSASYMSDLRAAGNDMEVLPLEKYGGIYNILNSSQPRIDHGTSHISVVDR
jgi:gamma-glutamyltranspeptidase